MRLPSLRTPVLVALSWLVLATGAPASATTSTPKNTHLLAMAACPPWKSARNAALTKLMAESCGKDLNAVVPALQKSLAISPDQTVTRLDKEANFSGVETAIKALAKRAKKSDRVVIYLNFHGGDLGAMYKGNRVKDEVLALYSKDRPANFTEATANHTWMTTKYLRDLIDGIKAEEIVVIIEACESESGLHDFRYDLARRYQDNWQGREAIIFSARADQAAAFTADRKMAQFTSSFSDGLLAAKDGSLGDVFHAASVTTHRAARETCMLPANRKKVFDYRASYLDGCTQMPMAFDPYGLLDDIKIGGASTDAKWRRVMAKSNADSDTPASAKTANATKAKAPAAKDPFDWAKPYLDRRAAAARNAAGRAQVQREMPAQAPAATTTTPSKKDPFAWAKPYQERTSMRSQRPTQAPYPYGYRATAARQ